MHNIQLHARDTKCVLKAKKFKEIGGYLLDNFKFCSKTRSRNICMSVMELFFLFPDEERDYRGSWRELNG